MASVLTPPKPQIPTGTDNFGGGGRGGGARGFGGPGDGGGFEAAGRSIPPRTYRTGMGLALVAIVMLFAAFTSALVVRQGISNDWVATAVPRILYLNTLVLLASSGTLELSRRARATGRRERFARLWYATTLLGLAFLVGQGIAWRQLAARGVYLATNPSSSFFYLLTAAHAVHLLGGVIALLYIGVHASRIAASARGGAVVDAAAMYWHFMDALWIYLFILLSVRL